MKMQTHVSPLPHASGGRNGSPLWAVLTIAFLGSIGTGVVTVGIYFMAMHAYGFSVGENYLLGLMLGLTYSGAALGAGPFMGWVRQHRFSTRMVTVWMLIVMGTICLVPLGAIWAGLHEQQWPIWVLVLIYSPLTGMHWPIVESFLSGGRSGARLRYATGRFNITWAGALVLGLAGIGPLVEAYAAEAIAALGLIHLATIPVLYFVGAEPGRHFEEEHEPHPVVFRQLLAVFRVLLPTSYIVLTALVPFLPAALTRLEVSSGWQAPLAATWTAARVLTFVAMERWHGWHGRWYPAVGGVVLLVGGFAVAVLAPAIGGPGALVLMLAALAAFGVGMAAIYAGALYYAMEVGKAEVAAGGMHEALIGVGYTVGPLCGLIAVGALGAGLVQPERFDAVILTLVGLIAAGALAAAIRASLRALRTGPNIHET